MNKMLDTEYPRLSEKAFLRKIGVAVPFEGVKAKEVRKRAFRANRKSRIAAKRAWLDT